MAVTAGHGNPHWTEDEVILALDLYFQLGGKIPNKSDQRVVSLSALLRTLPYHALAARQSTFRNPDGVIFKLQNLRAVATGKGLSNTAKVDQAVWSEYGSNPELTNAKAAAIRKDIAATQLIPDSSAQEDDEESFSEGRLATFLHKRREREKSLRKKVIAQFKGAPLRCAMCDGLSSVVHAEMEDASFEVHHCVPLAATGETRTRTADLALLCASCHRILHRAISLRKRWISIEEARSLVRKMGSGSFKN